MEEFENIKGKVTVCLNCKVVKISKDGSRICDECNYCNTIAYWPTKEKFFDYIGMNGLKDLVIKDVKLIDEILSIFSVK
ncbi:hypothetical protein [Thermosipho sp. (in: thermotogales)]|jgi:DNA polymerase III gamma/tau subunit|uniref:hypothetical protein n=1 Tax=Thermosipho sp. (in: thermotogales) TaxID=1968895 RepID=UPI0025803437|nr:hypothetical protein [Thermosipho sp. (in: thermotogales)]MBZ4649234.1 hypothetical protein [Thermosipho sp. (in: thermotogales)]